MSTALLSRDLKPALCLAFSERSNYNEPVENIRLNLEKYVHLEMCSIRIHSHE